MLATGDLPTTPSTPGEESQRFPLPGWLWARAGLCRARGTWQKMQRMTAPGSKAALPDVSSHGHVACTAAPGLWETWSSAQCPSSMLLPPAHRPHHHQNHLEGRSDGNSGNSAVAHVAPARLLPASSRAHPLWPPAGGHHLCLSYHQWQRNSCFLFITDSILKIMAKRNYFKNEIKGIQSRLHTRIINFNRHGITPAIFHNISKCLLTIFVFFSPGTVAAGREGRAWQVTPRGALTESRGTPHTLSSLRGAHAVPTAKDRLTHPGQPLIPFLDPLVHVQGPCSARVPNG